MRFLLGFVCLAAAGLSPIVSSAPPDPVVSVWYRGRPAGVPQADDLAAIHAAGFDAVTWPASSVVGVATVARMAEASGLTVVLRPDAAALTAASAKDPGDRATVSAAGALGPALVPIAWRAVAHGGRILSVDAGQPEGAGLRDAAGRTSSWVSRAAAVARQLRINGALITQLATMPPVNFDGAAPAALDVVLLEARKSWVLIATNTSPARARAVVHVPHEVPYAIWLNLLNGATLSMLAEPLGPRWNVDLEPYDARVYVIDKTLK